MRAKKTIYIMLALTAFFLLDGFLAGRGTSLTGILSGEPSGAPGVHGGLDNAISQQLSDVQVNGQGIVVRVLRDDIDGSRHQRFILKLDSGQTVLIAHNIDLAPRIHRLEIGDAVEFYGEYEWNPKGGVVHWTHHDPGGSHADGWLKHDGNIYQ